MKQTSGQDGVMALEGFKLLQQVCREVASAKEGELCLVDIVELCGGKRHRPQIEAAIEIVCMLGWLRRKDVPSLGGFRPGVRWVGLGTAAVTGEEWEWPANAVASMRSLADAMDTVFAFTAGMPTRAAEGAACKKCSV